MKTILYISPGPTFNAHSELYQSEYKELSREFRGYIYTTSPKQERFSIDHFNYVSMRFENSKMNRIQFFVFCIWHALELLLQGKRISLVVTYDPLLGGLTGLIIAFMHNAKFAPQVNGVYTSPAVWMDEPNTFALRLKMKTYQNIMRIVLKYSNGVRLLFREQVAPFNDVLHGKVIRDFHCFVATEGFRNIREDKEVLFVGFPFKLKGVDVLINAFKKVVPRYPDWKLKILGWYPNPHELYSAIGAHPQIYHHPPVHYEEMIEHIGTCAILVLPSRTEAMGRVLVEAMAAEKPRIGSKVDGIPTVINDGIDGFLFESGNVDDLAQKLDKLMGNQDLRRQMGLAGKERIAKEFTKEEYLKNIASFYREILKSPYY